MNYEVALPVLRHYYEKLSPVTSHGQMSTGNLNVQSSLKVSFRYLIRRCIIHSIHEEVQPEQHVDSKQ